MKPFPPVCDLVPHRAPALLLDELLEWQPGAAVLRAKIQPYGPFVAGDSADSLLSLELMAQGAAACLGYAAFRAGGFARPGMLVTVRRLQILRPRVRVGEVLTISVRQTAGNEMASAFEGEVLDGDRARVARAAMTIVHAESPPI